MPAIIAIALGVGVLGVGVVGVVGAGVVGAAPAQAATLVRYSHNCISNPSAGYVGCFALRRTDVVQPSGVQVGGLSPGATPAGLSPGDLQSAYNLPSATAGSGQTVAVIDAYNDPSAEADLGVYRAQYGLPACTTGNGCFKKVNQNGLGTQLPANNSGWSGEIALDLAMVSATCPNCKILLVETNSPTFTSLYAGVSRAITLGSKFISNSWGGGEYSNQTKDDGVFDRPGVAITASTGNNGDDPTYPSTSPYVTAVGGTHLATSGNSRGWAESAWSNAGTGCSSYDAPATWQAATTTSCDTRAAADVSAVADPATGVSVYQSYGVRGWQVYGGTSVGAPIIAATFALAGTPSSDAYPAAFPYTHSSSLFDITSGSSAACGAPLCDAGDGWDGPTGLGTPNGTAAFTAATTPPVLNTVTVTSPGPQSATVGTAFSLPVKATDSGATQTLSYTAAGLPDGVSIDAGTGLISGTPSASGSGPVTVTATDGTGAVGTVSFTVTVSPAPNTVAVTDPGAQNATVGTAFSLQIQATDSDPGETLTYTADGLPDGLTIDKATGLISGTPTTDGTAHTTVTATDSTGVDGSSEFTTTIKTPNTVTVSPPGDQTATVGRPFSLQIQATDSDAGETLTYTADGLPDGLTIDRATGLISGTPTTDGAVSSTITATDSTGIKDTASFRTVVKLPNVVTITKPGGLIGTVGTLLRLQIQATDSDPTETLTYTADGLPDGLSIDPATGLISGNPTTDGSSEVTVTATDSTGSTASTTFTQQIKLPNVVVVNTPGVQIATVDTPFSLQIAATDSDPSQTLTYAASGLPDGLSIDPTTGLISGTPTTAATIPVLSTITATDSTGVTGLAVFATTVNPACSPAQLLANPGFETGTALPWLAPLTAVVKAGTQPAHSGSYLALLDGRGFSHTDVLSQVVTIPAKCTNTTLSFWLKVTSQEVTPTFAFDKLTVKVGTDTLATYSNLNKGGDYAQKTFSLAAYAGKTVTLTFSGTEDSSAPTSFDIDDTAISTS